MQTWKPGDAKVTAAQRTQIVALYGTGQHTCQQIAGRFDLSTSHVSNLCRQAGIDGRALYAQRRLVLTSDQEAEIVALYLTGDVVRPQLARRYGVSTCTIGRVLRGIAKPRKPRPAPEPIYRVYPHVLYPSHTPSATLSDGQSLLDWARQHEIPRVHTTWEPDDEYRAIVASLQAAWAPLDARMDTAA